MNYVLMFQKVDARITETYYHIVLGSDNNLDCLV